MECPKCKSDNSRPVTSDGSKQYCVSCNHAWTAGRSNEPEGTLTCEGIISAKRLYDMLTRGSEHPPEVRALLETQVSGVLIDQWFNGFKSGQLASIVYSKDYYGKNRNESSATDRSRSSGTQRDENPSIRQNRIRGGTDDSANPRTRDSRKIVTERVAGIELRYEQRHIPIPEDVYKQLAATMAFIFTDTADVVEYATYDGTSVSLTLKSK